MVHEVKGVINFSDEEVKMISEKFGLKFGMGNHDLGIYEYNGITVTILCKETHKHHLFNNDSQAWYADIKLNFVDLLQKNNLNQADVQECYKLIDEFLSKFCFANHQDVLIESLEYSWDVYVENKDERKALLEIFHRSIEKSNRLVKKDYYENTMYHECASQKKKVYDKQGERRYKKIIPKTFEMNSIRFESVIKKSHLYYNYKHCGLKMTLDNYLTRDMYNKYMAPFVNDIYFNADYYNIYYAKKIINDAKCVRKKDKNELIGFLTSISHKRSIIKVKEEIGYYRFKKYIGLLMEININPIVIPKTMNISHIKSPVNSILIKGP